MRNMNGNGSKLLLVGRVDQKGNHGVKDRRFSHDARQALEEFGNKVYHVRRDFIMLFFVSAAW